MHIKYKYRRAVCTHTWCFSCWSIYHCFYLEKCGLGKTLRFLIKSSFLSSSHQNHFLLHEIIVSYIISCPWFQVDIFYHFLYFWYFFIVFTEKNITWEKMLRFLIKSYFLWSSHQNHFKFGTWIHCIILINMLVFTNWYFIITSFFVFYQCIYLWPWKSVKVSD